MRDLIGGLLGDAPRPGALALGLAWGACLILAAEPAELIRLRVQRGGTLEPMDTSDRVPSESFSIGDIPFRVVTGSPDALLRAGSPPAGLAARWQMRHWTEATGLPVNKLRSLMETRDGFLWIGSAAGAARFDGVRFTRIPLRAPGATARCLLEDSAGRLWLGTESGLVSWDGRGFRDFAGKEALRDLKINALLARGAGGLWLGTDSGLGRLDDSGWHPEREFVGRKIDVLAEAAANRV
jgi:hypothetical protein